MTSPHDDDRVDRDLPGDLLPWLDELQALAEPVPELDLALATAAFASRDLDAELVALWDSREHAEPVLRGGDDAWELSLSVGEPDAAPAGTALTDVVLTVVPQGDRRRLIGSVTGDLPDRLALEWPGGGSALELDELGRFEGEVPSGPLRVRCTWPQRRVVSSWVTV